MKDNPCEEFQPGLRCSRCGWDKHDHEEKGEATRRITCPNCDGEGNGWERDIFGELVVQKCPVCGGERSISIEEAIKKLFTAVNRLIRIGG